MIRKFEDKDMDAKLEIWYQASLIAHPFLSEAFLDQERENLRTIYSTRSDTWVYEEAGQVVGFISLLGNEVGGIFVYPEWQGRGVGRALMDKARDIHGALELEVFAENPKARRFYNRYGFVAFKEYFHEESGFMMVRMRLEG